MADVAILTAANMSVAVPLTRIARACVQWGLTVEFLLNDLYRHSPAELDLYAATGVPVVPLDLGDRTWPVQRSMTVLELTRLARRVERMVRARRPRSVLTHIDSWGVERTLHWAAQRAQIPGLVVQEGPVANYKPAYQPGWGRSRLRRGLSRLVRRLDHSLLRVAPLYEYADHVAVWGEARRRQLIAAGRPAERIAVTGNAGMDDRIGRAPLAPRERRTVVFAHQHQPNPQVEREANRTLIDVCANRLGCKLLFRPHPRSTVSAAEIRALVAATTPHSSLVEVIDQGDVNALYPRASVFTTYYSTAAYHAVIAGLPMVLLDWVSPLYQLDASAYGAALSVTSPDGLEGALRSALDDDAVRQRLHAGSARYVTDHLFALDGGAAARVAAVVAALVGRV